MVRPDVCFFVLFTDEITRETMKRLSMGSGAVTVNWFGDDHRRFLPFSRHWAPLFDWVITTDPAAVERYNAIGCRNVVRSQWGFNPRLVPVREKSQEFDVTFVGQVHARRRAVVKELRQAGVNVGCWGRGWENPRLSTEDTAAMFSRSRINLNFTESSVVAGWKRIAKIFFTRRADDSVRINSPVRMVESVRAMISDRRPQINARNFEVPGQGGFLLTAHADNLEEYFVPGEELAVFRSTAECGEKIRYYLDHPDECETIRRAGHARALRDHTYEKRFLDIFKAIGIQTGVAPSGRA
jgi:spore maturation protein CgeB